MAKKPEAEPLLAHKHAFVDSLDNVMAKSIVLLQIGEQVVDLKLIKNENIAKMFAEHLAAFKKSIFND